MNRPGHIPPNLRAGTLPREFAAHPLIDRYKREYIDFHQISKRGWRTRLRCLWDFHERLEADGRDFPAITGADLQSFAGDLLAGGLHVNSVRAEMNAIRWFANWLYGAKLITADQYLSIKAIRDPRGSTSAAQPRPYSREDLDRFYAALNERWPKIPDIVTTIDGRCNLAVPSVERWLLTGHNWRPLRTHARRVQAEAIVALALHCALRAGEIWSLSVEDLDPELRYLVVKAKRTDHRERLREVPYTTPTRDAVRAWLTLRAKLGAKHDRPWIRLRRGAELEDAVWPMNRIDMYELLPNYIGKEWRLHRFRHTAATERLRAGADVEIVSRWLGHSSIRQTEGYLEIVKQDIQRVMSQTEDAFVERISERTMNERLENHETALPKRAERAA